MKRRGIFILILLLAGVYLAGPWLFGAPSGSPPQVSLSLGDTSSLTISQGAPLTFDIYLKGSSDTRIGGLLKPWHSYILLRFGDGKLVTWPLIQDKKPFGESLVKTKDSVRVKTHEGSRASFSNSADYYRVMRYLSPEISASLPEGEYSIRASVEVPRFLFLWSKTIASSEHVKIRIMKRGANSDIDRDSDQMKIESYLKIGDFKKTIEASRVLVEKEPNDPALRILHGDALFGIGNKKEALDSFLHARALIPPAYEEPIILNRKIEEARH